jgi:AraC-like DNA-binding protein
LILHGKDGTIKRVNEKYGYSDPLHFVLMFPRGEQGWEIETYPKKNLKSEIKVTMKLKRMKTNRK